MLYWCMHSMMHCNCWDNTAISLLTIATHFIWSVITYTSLAKQVAVLPLNAGRLLLVNAVGWRVALSGTLSFPQFISCITCSPKGNTRCICHQIQGFWSIVKFHACTFSNYLHGFVIKVLIHPIPWQISIYWLSFHNGSQTSAVTGENLFRWLRIPRNDRNSFFDFVWGIFKKGCTYLGSGITPCCNMILWKKECLDIWKAFVFV